MPLSRNVQMLNAIKYGAWIRTRQPPFRAVVFVPETREDGRQRMRGRRWREVMRAGDTREPDTFFAEDVTPAGPMEPLEYPPAKGEPICGYWMAEEPAPGQLFNATAYCPRYVDPGNLCPKHEAKHASMTCDHEEEEPT